MLAFSQLSRVLILERNALPIKYFDKTIDYECGLPKP